MREVEGEVQLVSRTTDRPSRSLIAAGVTFLALFVGLCNPQPGHASLPVPVITAGPTQGSYSNNPNVSFSFSTTVGDGFDPQYDLIDHECALGPYVLIFSSCVSGSLPTCAALPGAQFFCAENKVFTPLRDGIYKFRVRLKICIDKALPDACKLPRDFVVGPYSEREFLIDTLPPVVERIQSRPNMKLTSESAIFDFTTSERLVTSRCSIDLGVPVACVSGFAAKGLAPGWHSIAVTATDFAGNIGRPLSENFIIQKPPSATKRKCKSVKVKRHGKTVIKKKCKKTKAAGKA